MITLGNCQNLELTHKITYRKPLYPGKRNALYTSKAIEYDLVKCMKELMKKIISRRLPTSFRDQCLKSKLTKLQILQTLSSWKSFCNMYLRKNQEKGYQNKLTAMRQLTKNYAIAFSKCLKRLLLIANIADLRQWMEWQTSLDEIKDVQFFCKRKLPYQLTTTVPTMFSISNFINVPKSYVM